MGAVVQHPSHSPLPLPALHGPVDAVGLSGRSQHSAGGELVSLLTAAGEFVR